LTPNGQISECFLTRRARKAKLLDHDLALRAALASNLLGANAPEQMLYLNCCIDADGKLFNGANKYILRFELVRFSTHDSRAKNSALSWESPSMGRGH
jgi:hypothetical protein